MHRVTLTSFSAWLDDPHGSVSAQPQRTVKGRTRVWAVDARSRARVVEAAHAHGLKLTTIDRYTAHAHDGTCAGDSECVNASCLEVYSLVPAEHVTIAIAETLMIWDDAYKEGTAPPGALDLVDAGNTALDTYSRDAHLRIVEGLAQTAQELLDAGTYGSDLRPSRPDVELLASFLTDSLTHSRHEATGLVSAAATGLAHAHMIASARALTAGVTADTTQGEVSQAVIEQVQAAHSAAVPHRGDSRTDTGRTVKVTPTVGSDRVAPCL